MYFRIWIMGWVLLSAISGAAQGPGTTGGGRLPSFEDGLRRHHIALTRQAIVAALRDPNPEVRSLAAQKLAEDDAKDAAPAISRAIASEKVPSTRANLGYALAKLGDKTGLLALGNVCEDAGAPEPARLEAIRLALGLGQEIPECLSGLLSLLETGSPGSRQSAAWLVGGFHDLSREESDRLFATLTNALTAPEPAVRQASSHALGVMGNPNAIGYLRDAISRETDDSVRMGMKADLQKLQSDSP